MDQTLGEYLMKLECESTNCFSWKSGAAPGANCPVQKENANIPIIIQSLAWKFQQETLKPYSGLVMLTAAWVVPCELTSLPCCVSWVVGDCYRERGTRVQVSLFRSRMIKQSHQRECGLGEMHVEAFETCHETHVKSKSHGGIVTEWIL